MHVTSVFVVAMPEPPPEPSHANVSADSEEVAHSTNGRCLHGWELASYSVQADIKATKDARLHVQGTPSTVAVMGNDLSDGSQPGRVPGGVEGRWL